MDRQLRLAEMPLAYCLDASSLIDLKRWYPKEMKTFLPIWTKIEAMVSDGRIISPLEVQKEISFGNDEIVKWCKQNKFVFKDLDSCQIQELQNVKGKYAKDYWQKEINKDGHWGDPWVIALSICEEAIIVTNENKEKANRIPIIAKEFDIKSLQLLELFKEIGIE
jgi:hypothetical protein